MKLHHPHIAPLRLPDPGSVDGLKRTVIREPSVSWLYTAIPFHQDAWVLIIDECMNANGPKAFREAMTLSEELRLRPEKSTDAFVPHRREAQYFNV